MSERAASDASRPLAVAVLAAGNGTRLKLGDDAPPKVLLECLGAVSYTHLTLPTITE